MVSTFFKSAVTLCLVALWIIRRTRSRLPLPPGPRKLPLVGNLLDRQPPGKPWQRYMAWSKQYDSDIIHLNMAGKSLIIISSEEAANDLLDKRSLFYSFRPKFPMMTELMGYADSLGFLQYGNRWRTQRKFFHHTFNITAAQRFRPKQRAACHSLLRHILEDPENTMEHVRQMVATVIISVAYGIEPLPHNDPHILLSDQVMRTASFATVPGRFLVDTIPVLKYVPAWFPGAGFKRQAVEWKAALMAMVNNPFLEAKSRIAMGTATPSFTSHNLETLNEVDDKDKEYYEKAIKSAAGSMYGPGTTTTVSAIGTFILAMLANPEAQKKAQAEIDSVVGGDQLPNYEHEASLPYVNALIKEVLRWKNVTPIAFPHFLQVEDEYRGYRIPANSTVIANIWAMFHDEAKYEDPDVFKPERWINGSNDSSDSSIDAVFGFGRRICPGRHMAMSSLFISITSILATFDITKAVGEDGQVIEPSYDYFPGLVVMPLPFKCSILPRNKDAVRLIQATSD